MLSPAYVDFNQDNHLKLHKFGFRSCAVVTELCVCECVCVCGDFNQDSYLKPHKFGFRCCAVVTELCVCVCFDGALMLL